jgi:subtilisin family serine protease
MRISRRVLSSIFALFLLLSLFPSPAFSAAADGRSAASEGSVGALAAAGDGGTELGYVPGEVIVVFKEGVREQAAKFTIMSADGEPSEALNAGDGVVAELVTLPEGLSVPEAVAEFERDPNVDFAQPNYIYRLFDYEPAAAVTPNDPNYTGGAQWHLNDPAGDKDIDAPEAWGELTISGGKAPVRVAVIDATMDLTHEDLAANLDKAAARDFKDGIENTTYPADSTIGDGHGTHVAGIIGAVSNNNKGVAGVATGGVDGVVQIIPINVFEVYGNEIGASTTALAGAVNYSVAANAKVINMSLGLPADALNASDLVVSGAVSAAVNAGVTVVCAAGNYFGTQYPIPYPVYPGGLSDVICVVNTDRSGDRNKIVSKGISNYPPPASGAEAHAVSAPGTEIMSTLPGSVYGLMTGTSMAAPVVTGIAAMMLYENPGLRPAEIRDILKSTSKNKDLTTADGGKRVDADAAIIKARSTVQIQASTAQITGTRRYAQTLTADVTLTNTNPGTLEYAWTRSGATIEGATGKTYTLEKADIGKTVGVIVSASNYTTTLTVSDTAAVAKALAPSLTWPAAQSVVYGAKLSGATLSGGSTELGAFAWANPDTVPPAGSAAYPVNFTPSGDTLDCYEDIPTKTQGVTVAVSKANVSGVNRSVGITPGTGHNFDLSTLLPQVPGLMPAYTANETSDSYNILTVGTLSGGILPLDVISAAGADQTAAVTVNVSSGNYNDFSATITVKAIGRATVKIEDLSSADATYDGLAHAGYTGTPRFTVNGTAVNPVPVSPALTARYTGNTAAGHIYDRDVAPTAAGIYTVTLTLENDANYYGLWHGNFTVEKATPSYNTPSLSAVYGDTLADVTAAGFVWKDAPGTSAGPVGTRNFLATYTPADAVNYKTLPDISIPVTVAPKALSVKGAVAVHREYDGTKDVALTFGMLDGVLPADEGGVGFLLGGGAVADKNAGDGKPVTTHMTLTGDKASNYALAQPTDIKVNIARKRIRAEDMSPISPSKAQDGGVAISFAARLKDGVTAAGDSVTLTLTGAYDTAVVGMSKAVTVTDWQLSGADASNYELDSALPTGITGSIYENPGSSSGGSFTPAPEEKAEEKAEGESKVSVSYTQSGATVTVALPDDKVTEFIEKSAAGGGDKVATIDVSAAANAVSAELPKAALTKLAEAKLAVEIKLAQGCVKLDSAAAESLTKQAGGNSISVRLGAVETSSLDEGPRAAAEGAAAVYDISVSSGGKSVTRFDGALVTVALPYALKDGERPGGVVVRHIDASGDTQNMDTSYDEQTKTAVFKTNHLSLYAVAYDPALAWENPFTDVPADSWFIEYVKYVHANGIMTGISDARFGPDERMTRAMLVTILYRLHGGPVVRENAAFDDVDDTAWYGEAVNWAAQSGIVNGVAKGRFEPDGNVTREQFAAILLRYAAFTDADPQGNPAVRLDFKDADKISDWAVEGAMYCYRKGILTGKPGGLFDAQGTAARAEVAAMLYRYTEAL